MRCIRQAAEGPWKPFMTLGLATPLGDAGAAHADLPGQSLPKAVQLHKGRLVYSVSGKAAGCPTFSSFLQSSADSWMSFSILLSLQPGCMWSSAAS